VNERAIRFGAHNALVGVLTEPANADDARPTLVFLNSGILHHVGASRLYVRLARVLAVHGFRSLRFDLAGIGDSEPRRDSLGPMESALRDGTEALDYLASTRDAQAFVLAGLCSGSDMAFHLALRDERVKGIVNLDAWAYRTWRYYARRYGPKLLDGAVWRNSIRVRLRGLLGRDAGSGANPEVFVPPEYRRVFPPRGEVEQGLRTLLGRGVRLFHFFSGGMEPHLNHAEQYERSFRSLEFGDCVRVVYRPEADHTVTNLEHQAFVIDEIVGWIRQNYGADTPVGG